MTTELTIGTGKAGLQVSANEWDRVLTKHKQRMKPPVRIPRVEKAHEVAGLGISAESDSG